MNCQPFLPIFNHFPYFFPLFFAMYNGQDVGRVDCLLKDHGSMFCTFCLCQTPDMTITIPVFFFELGGIGYGEGSGFQPVVCKFGNI